MQQIREIIVQHPGFEHSITVTRIGGTASPEGQKTKNIVLAKKRAETAWTNDVGPTLAKEFGLDFNLPDGLDIDGQINEDLTGDVNQMAQDLRIRLTDNRGRKKNEEKLKKEVDSQIRQLRQKGAKHEIFAKLDASRYVEVEVQVQLTQEVKHDDPGKIKPDPKLPEIYIIKLRAKVDDKTIPNSPKGGERVLPPGTQIGHRKKGEHEAQAIATNRKTKARRPVTKQRAIGLHAGAGSIGGQGRGPGNRIR